MKPDVSCEVNGINCINYYDYPERCKYCYNQSFFVPNKIKSPISSGSNKKSKRLGAKFEKENHDNNQALLSAASSMTPNSGAGSVKGDEQITGIINVMEELKTKVKEKTARGSKTFTVHKEWLDKLNREASLENKEFWYLKFKFLESDNDTYVIVGQDIIMSMIKTMVVDRQKSLGADSYVNIFKTKNRELEAKLVAAEATILSMQAQIDYLKHKNKI